MMHSEQYRRRVSGSELWAIIAAVVIAILMIVLATEVHAQNPTVKRDFADGTGAASPPAVLTIDHTDPMR
jgi:uncharacterized membrane protein YdjX (TVP38/TMEM64 family)